jgi:myxalamid-type nonribosomal peptide synthetase MxaA
MSIDHLSPQEKRALLESLLRHRAGSSAIDLEAEARIDVATASAAAPPTGDPRDIFLTGATGFVGAFVLRELLDRTSARVHCLVRAADASEGRARIEENLRSYDIPAAGLDDRMVAVPGDLAQARLGLTEARWAALADGVDTIHHVAALVNLAHDYRQLKPTNVEGTREIIRLATTGRVKPLHYLSSYAVFDSMYNVGRKFSERDEPVQHERLSNGYAESKWVAEAMVRRCHVAGVPAAVYRVGWVIGDSRTGAWKSADFIPRLLKAAVETGMCCDFGTFTMTPVDYVARAFVHLAGRRDSIGQVFHLSNGVRYASRSLFAWMRAEGYDLREVTLEEWQRQLRGASQELSLTPLLLFLEDIGGGISRLSQWLSNEPDVDVTLTRQALAQSGVECPELDARQMAVYLERFVATGHIPRPVSRA